MRRQVIITLAFFICAAVACSTAGDPGTDLTGDTSADRMTTFDLVFSSMDGEVVHEVRFPDMAPADFGPSCEPGTGCFLDHCDSDTDCLSGYCVGHMGDSVCTITCIEDCQAGWTCEEFATGPDQVFLCLSSVAHLCRPCTTSNDCRSPSGVEDVCVDFGPDGDFCGAACDEDDDCPSGYRCDPVSTTEGVELLQCVPEKGICECSPKSIALGLLTVCEVENEFGLCTGTRVCAEGGLTPCDAKEPAEEVCSGLDDDCDGDTDEATCDDGNPCTEDACVPEEGGCEHVSVSGIACDDEDVCTIADHCEDGVCSGTFVDCDDKNPCTTDICDASGGCLYEFNDGACDDGDPCTVNDHCDSGICWGTEVPCDCVVDDDCEPFEDGDVCNGVLICDLEQFPHKCVVDTDSIINCPPPEDPFEECLVSLCDPATGFCDVVPVEDDSPCDDDDICTQADACLDGECVGAVPLICYDGNPCTDDTCDSLDGCVHTPNDAPCNDGDACSYGDACQGGVCVGGEDLDCDDMNTCTDDSCDALLGCVHLHNQAQCDDSNACTVTDGCVAGICVGVGLTDCDDGNPCTHDWCDLLSGCQHDNHTLPCNDGDACIIDEACLDGACAGGQPLNCNDGNPCTQDTCDSLSGCVHLFNSSPCNDGNACTVSDVCSMGACSGAEVISCSDGNSCTEDTCDPDEGCLHSPLTGECNDGNVCTVQDMCQDGLCIGTLPLDCDDGNQCTDDYCTIDDGCVNVPNNAACSDGDPCTSQDACLNGVCVGFSTTNCDDSNPCTDDSCDFVFGCLNAYNMDPCDDGNQCTSEDLCIMGVCKGTGATDCDDLNPCTYDTCLPSGGCDYAPVSGACNDGDLCTIYDSCDEGVCVGGTPKTCDDLNTCTADDCQDGMCTHLPLSGSSCSDGNLCTINDTCQGITCAGDPVLCDDGNACTVDYCDPAAGCVGQEIEDHCDDGNPCTEGACNPLTGCYFSPKPGPCDDGNACTVNETCSGGICAATIFLDCDDENPCTDDVCLLSSGCYNTPNSNPCEDGDICTLQDYCAGGGCVSGTARDCDDGNPCTDDSCHAVFGCEHDNNSDGCDDGNPCTNSDQCSSGACTGGGLTDCTDSVSCTVDSCSPIQGCVHTSIDALCFDDISCTLDTCGPDGCSVELDHDACDDGDPCTEDICDLDLGCINSDICG